MLNKTVLLVLALVMTLLIVGCRPGSEVIIYASAESELDPAVHSTIALLDFEYDGEWGFGELTAQELRKAIDSHPSFNIVPPETVLDGIAGIEDFDELRIDDLTNLAERLPADLVVTGTVNFYRYGGMDYTERLSSAYDAGEETSPSMLIGRSTDAYSRDQTQVYVLEITLKGYDGKSGELVWKREADLRSEVDAATVAVTPSYSELMQVFNQLIRELTKETRTSLEPHEKPEYRIIVP